MNSKEVVDTHQIRDSKVIIVRYHPVNPVQWNEGYNIGDKGYDAPRWPTTIRRQTGPSFVHDGADHVEGVYTVHGDFFLRQIIWGIGRLVS